MLEPQPKSKNLKKKRRVGGRGEGLSFVSNTTYQTDIFLYFCLDHFQGF